MTLCRVSRLFLRMHLQYLVKSIPYRNARAELDTDIHHHGAWSSDRTRLALLHPHIGLTEHLENVEIIAINYGKKQCRSLEEAEWTLIMMAIILMRLITMMTIEMTERETSKRQEKNMTKGDMTERDIKVWDMAEREITMPEMATPAFEGARLHQEGTSLAERQDRKSQCRTQT